MQMSNADTTPFTYVSAGHYFRIYISNWNYSSPSSSTLFV